MTEQDSEAKGCLGSQKIKNDGLKSWAKPSEARSWLDGSRGEEESTADPKHARIGFWQNYKVKNNKN